MKESTNFKFLLQFLEKNKTSVETTISINEVEDIKALLSCYLRIEQEQRISFEEKKSKIEIFQSQISKLAKKIERVYSEEVSSVSDN